MTVNLSNEVEELTDYLQEISVIFKANLSARGIRPVANRKGRLTQRPFPSHKEDSYAVAIAFRFLRHHTMKPPPTKTDSNPGKPAPTMGVGTGETPRANSKLPA